MAEAKWVREERAARERDAKNKDADGDAFRVQPSRVSVSTDSGDNKDKGTVQDTITTPVGQTNVALQCQGNICLDPVTKKVLIDLTKTDCEPEKARAFLEKIVKDAGIPDVEWKMPPLVKTNIEKIEAEIAKLQRQLAEIKAQS